MKRLDRYILAESIPPFLFGIGAFLAVLIGVELLYDMLRLVYQEGFPAWSVARIFVLKLPGVIVLTFPMAIMFGSLMAMGRLSGDGELVAIRAGGVSVVRVGLPVMLLGVVVAMAGFAVSETVVPWANNRSLEITRQMFGTVAAETDLALEVRNDQGLQRWLYAAEFDPDTLTLRHATILDFTLGERPHLLTAESARWQGRNWILRNVEHTSWDAGSEGTLSFEKMTFSVERTAESVGRARKKPNDMTLGELKEQVASALEEGRAEWAQKVDQHYHVRLALPWATVGLSILGIGLGIQRQRSSRGIGMGISLLVIFVYYVVMHTLTLVGERGVAHPALMAWTPNLLLFLAGAGFLLRNSR
ncbi:MAG: LptF/LptG family permease [Armatimonadota bacterium]|jgi:lipopolysaccharide export system permease protein